MIARAARQWGQVLLVTGGAQVAVQALAFASGILVIRMLAPEQYAFYTIANTALGAMTVLSDSGLSTGVMARGGPVWQDRGALGSVLTTGLVLRRRLAAIVLVVVLPATYLLLQRQDAPVLLAVVVTLSIVPLFIATLTTNMLEVIPRLHQELVPLQRIQVIANASRLAALLLILPLLPFAAVASVVAAAPQVWANWRLRRQAAVHADRGATEHVETRRALLAQIRRTLPLTLYYVVSAQLTVLLVSLFGTTHDVAAVGALGRLAMILSSLGAVFTMIALPRFARLEAASHRTVRDRYWQAQVALVAVGLLPVLLLVFLPGPVMALLGPNYSGLDSEAVLFAASSVVSVACGAAMTLGASRGVVVPPLLALPYCITVQAVLIALLPIDTVTGIVWVTLYSSLSQWALHVVYFYARMSGSRDPGRDGGTP